MSWDAYEQSRFALPPQQPGAASQPQRTTVRWSPDGAAVLVSESNRVLLIEPMK